VVILFHQRWLDFART